MKDDDIKGVENSLDYGARHFDPRLARFNSIDPMKFNFPSMSNYSYAENNPIRYIDYDGYAGGDNLYTASANVRTIWFSLRHPLIAYEIGESSTSKNTIETNISSNAARIARNTKLSKGDGGEINAVRHAVWQSSITIAFGEKIAKEVGDAHEDNPCAGNTKGIKTLADADRTADILNNEIGRTIGKNNPNASLKDLALKALEYFNTNGLFTAQKQSDGTYNVEQTKLSDDEYKKAKNNVDKLDRLGCDSEQHKIYINQQEEINKKAEKLR
jgi:RHS repeat-associated protein